MIDVGYGDVDHVERVQNKFLALDYQLKQVRILFAMLLKEYMRFYSVYELG